MAQKRTLSKMERITRVVVWLMLIAMVGTLLISVVAAIIGYLG